MNKKRNVFSFAAVLLFSLFGVSGCDLYDAQQNPINMDTEEEYPVDDYDPGVLSNLAGTKWLWGSSLLEFTDTTAIFRRNQTIPPYAYRLDMVNKKGSMDVMGEFIISDDYKFLEIVNYRSNTPNDKGVPYNAIFRILRPGNLVFPDTLVGTEWNVDWNSGGKGERFQDCQWIIFFTKTEALNFSGDPVGNVYHFVHDYTYNRESKTGNIAFIGNDFEVLEDGKKLYIPDYKNYHHGMTCTRVR
jgi:hypothetical protein